MDIGTYIVQIDAKLTFNYLQFAEKVAKKIKAAAKQEKGRDQNTDRQVHY